MKSFLQYAFSIAALFALQPTAHAGLLADHPGRWLGAITIANGTSLKIGAELFTRADGSAWASFAAPDQGAYDIAVSAINETSGTLNIAMPKAALKLNWSTDHFVGEFKEDGGASFPIEMKKVDAFPMKMRPQTPKAPFPYTDETLAITSTDGVMLGATLSIPKSVARPNVVVLVHGSGPNSRDQNGEGHQRFAVLADYLARQGIAVLRYDKRGIARSTGDYEQHTGAQLAEDLHAAVKTLKSRNAFNRIGLIGHSEGPGIAAAVAARHPGTVDFVVSLAGVGLPGIDMMLLQDRATAKANGAPTAEVDGIVAYARQYYKIIIAEANVDQRIAALNALEGNRSAKDKQTAAKYKMNQGSLSMDMAGKPFLRGILMANTQLDWRAVRCPVLALNGSLDQQVPAKENLSGIVASLKQGGNAKVEAVVLPSLNHMFQTAKTGAEDEYGRIDETIAPAALQRVAKFVKTQN